MRIIEATDCFPPPLTGGRDLAVKMLSHELLRRGHEVEVVTLAGSDGPRMESDDGLPVHRLAGWSRALSSFYAEPDKPFHPTLPDPGLVRTLAGILRRTRPHVVHAHSWLLYSLLPLLPSQRTGLVVWLHDQAFICPKTTFVHRGRMCTGPHYLKCVNCASTQYGPARSFALTTGMTAMRPWRRRPDRFVANSHTTARASTPLLGAPGHPMEVIPPFVPDEAFRADTLPRPAFVPPLGDYLMFAGGLGSHKGLDVLLEAWAGLTPRPPLVLAGIRRPDTPTSFPPGVTVAEDVPHGDVLAGWGNCLAAVVPSVWPEPFGMVAVEAMAAGKPVVASAIGGLAELVVDGTTGLLVPPGDADALREAIQTLIDNPRLRSQMGAQGRERATSYRADVSVTAWERVFQEVVRNRDVKVGTSDKTLKPSVVKR